MIQYSNKAIDFFRLNTSAVYVLPIFDILFGELAVNSSNIYFSSYALDHYLINTYLDPIHDQLDLVFINTPSKIPNRKRDVLMNFIISSEYYNRVIVSNKDVLGIKLNIPSKYVEDLKAIRENRIDDLSWGYIMPFQERYNTPILRPETTLGDLYMGFNIPLAIIQKIEVLYDYFESELKVKLDRNKYLSNPYDPIKEKFQLNNIEKYLVL